MVATSARRDVRPPRSTGRSLRPGDEPVKAVNEAQAVVGSGRLGFRSSPADRYSPRFAVQFTTTVIGSPVWSPMRSIARNRWPSGRGE